VVFEVSGERHGAVEQSDEVGRADPDERHDIAEVLRGFKIHPLDPDEVPLEVFLLIKARDSEGRDSWSYRTTKRPNREELLGALMVQVDFASQRTSG
jgi:hypothetical protein